MVKIAGRQFGAFTCPYEDAVIRIADPSEVQSNHTADFVKCEAREEEATLDMVRDRLDRGYAELIHVPRIEGVQMFVDEMGRARGRPFNPVASGVANQPLYGPAVILVGKARWT